MLLFFDNMKRLYSLSEIWPNVLSHNECFLLGPVHFSTLISCLSISKRAGGEKAVPSRLHRPGLKLMTVLYSLSFSLWLTFLIAVCCIFHTFVTLPFVAFNACTTLLCTVFIHVLDVNLSSLEIQVSYFSLVNLPQYKSVYISIYKVYFSLSIFPL